MKVTLTAKLKLTHTLEQKQALDKVTLAYRDALNFTSSFAFEAGKLSQAAKLQKLVYSEIRSRFLLPSQMACNIPRTVAATYKTLWTRAKRNSDAKKANPDRVLDEAAPVGPVRKIKRYKGLDAAPKFVSRTLTYSYERDFGFKTGQKVSVQTLEGRLVLPYEGYQKHLEYIAQGAEIGAGKLWYDKAKKQYYLLVSLEVELPATDSSSYKKIVGIDVGQRYHAVVTDSRNKSMFFSGQETNQRKDHYVRIRKSLQRKGTRSATRRLVLLSGRERRFIADRNHQLSSHILARYPQAILGLEDLTHIRERTEGHSSPKSSQKARKARKRRSQWSFAELQTFVAYKAPLQGSFVVKVDAHYTSQQCVGCGHTSRGNRPHKGLMFRCEVCGYELHSDLLGARNIALRTLLVRQDWTSTGVLSAHPDVSDAETKTARLSRYAGLRWSPDANPDYNEV